MINFHFIGWNNEGSHDKIWTSFSDESGNYYIGWGRRGSKLQFKRESSRPYTTERSKKNRGYSEVDSFVLFTLFPAFEETVAELLFVRSLDGSLR